jgi:hypothetical protein
MSVLKNGVHFISQDTDCPITQEEIPFIISNLTFVGMRRAAIIGFVYLQQNGYTLNEALDTLGENLKEREK